MTEDYTVLAVKAGIVGQRGRLVEVAIRRAAKQFGLTITNPPGSILESPNGSYQVQRNGTLLALSQDKVFEAEIVQTVEALA